jgi:DMSO/TMAO reductase YedYZ molybdopterin-dependent catalytic subunit
MGKKRNTLMITSATAIIALVLIVYYVSTISVAQSTSNQLPSGGPPQWQIMTTGNFDGEKTWSLNEITQMPLTNVTANINGENATYIGVALSEFCNITGMQWDTGSLEVIGTQGAQAELNVFQVWNSTNYPYRYNENVIVLAFAKNGIWLDAASGGPVRLIAPNFPASFQVEEVAELRTNLWQIVVSGKVANSLLLTSQNLSSFQTTKVQAEFAPGGAPRRTSNWTGVMLIDILHYASYQEDAKTVTVIAVDRYKQSFTLQQLAEAKIMLGYKENQSFLPLDQGGPFRLFLPTQEYKWGQYWVKFVSQIIVS